MANGTDVLLDYTNWRGERSSRIVRPITGSLRFAETPHHKPAQWVFDAWDGSKGGARRTFALSGVHSMTPRPDSAREVHTDDDDGRAP